MDSAASPKRIVGVEHQVERRPRREGQTRPAPWGPQRSASAEWQTSVREGSSVGQAAQFCFSFQQLWELDLSVHEMGRKPSLFLRRVF